MRAIRNRKNPPRGAPTQKSSQPGRGPGTQAGRMAANGKSR